jgi:Rrf2 family nitric oxide-sensitive transcriptional repressor
LTKFTDYALRVLLLAASRREGERLTIDDAAETFNISRAHLKKVVLHLSQAGFLTGTRGRSGGLTLARPPADINIGAVIRSTEPDFGLFECYLAGNACRVTRGCRLASVGNRALAAFMAVFDACTLEDALLDGDLLGSAAPDDTQQPLRGPRLPPVGAAQGGRGGPRSE